MTTKTFFAAALLGAAALATAGVVLAQANPPTSTPGAGCTATANAMRGGNLGGTPNNNINCAQPGAAQAAATTTTETTTTAQGAGAAPAVAATESAAPAPRAARVARADRN